MSHPQASKRPVPGVLFSLGGDDASLKAMINHREYRARLESLVCGDERSPSETVAALLDLGTEWFEVEHGHLASIDPAAGTHTIMKTTGPYPTASEGVRADLSRTYCRTILSENKSLAVADAPEQGWAEDPAYQHFGHSTYVGAKVVVDEALYGTVCFVDRDPRDASFREPDMAALELVARYVGRELERSQDSSRIQELRRERDRFERLVNEVREYAIFMIGPEGCVRSWNEGARRIKGYEADEIIGKPLATFYTEEDRKAHVPEDNLARAKDEGSIHEEGWRLRADGSRFWADVTITALYEDDELRGFSKVTRDMTERRARERELREANELLEKTLESLHEVAMVVDPSERRVIMCNSAVEDTFGYEKEEIIGRGTKFLHLDDASHKHFGKLSEAALEEEGSFTCEYQMRRKDGRIIDMEHRITPLQSDDWPRGVVSVIRDVSERKERENALKEGREKVEALYMATSQLLRAENEMEVGRSILQLVNEVFGYLIVVVRHLDHGELVPVQLSPKIQTYMPDRPAFAVEGSSVVAEAFRKGRTIVYDDLRTVDDSHDYGAVRSSVIVPIGERGTISIADVKVGSIDDFDRRLIEVLATYASLVLDRLERESELVEAKETAEEAVRLKTTMLANMSHEIRTPLTSVTGFAEILEDNLNGEMKGFAQKIRRSGSRLQKTLNSVLQLSQLEAGTKELTREPVELGAIAEQVVELFRREAEYKGVSLEVETEPTQGCWNEAALARVIENLVENAIKFTPEGGSIDVRVQVDGAFGTVEVEDTGVGIEEAVIPEIFEAFKQESVGLDREFEGTGLGLSIVERLTEGLGGTVHVKTQKGRGSRFVVRLPRTDEDDVASDPD